MTDTSGRSRAVPKFFVQMSGAPGSGKSTTAKLLAPSIDGVVIDHDIIRSTILAHQIQFKEAAKLAYDLGWALADDLLSQGRSVIIDSPCNYQEAIDRGTTLAQRYGFDYWYVECKVDDIELLDERLRQRVPLRSQRTGVDRLPPDASGYSEDARTLFDKWIKAPCRPESHAVIVDSTGSPEERRDYILEQILRFD